MANLGKKVIDKKQLPAFFISSIKSDTQLTSFDK